MLISTCWGSGPVALAALQLIYSIRGLSLRRLSHPWVWEQASIAPMHLVQPLKAGRSPRQSWDSEREPAPCYLGVSDHQPQ